MIAAGLDPGKNGALVTLFEDGSTIVNRVPLVKREPRAGRKTSSPVPDHEAWERIWSTSIALAMPDVFVIEATHGWKGQAAGASYAFGHSAGFVYALALGARRPIHWAPPSVWKSRLKISQNKDDAIAEALRLIPSLIPHLKLKKDDGVAEAGLLAYYAIMTIAHK